MKNSEENTLSTILFDLDNTLIDRQEAVRKFLGTFVSKKSQIEQERFLNKAMELDAWGYEGPDKLCDWLAQVVGYSTSSGYWLQMKTQLASFVQPNEQILTLLGQIKETAILGIITNGSEENQYRKYLASGLNAIIPESHLFISGAIGYKKPSKAIFYHCCERLGCSPTTTLYVGDNPEADIVGASNVGMKTCWIRHGRLYPSELQQPDWSYEHILNFLEMWARKK